MADEPNEALLERVRARAALLPGCGLSPERFVEQNPGRGGALPTSASTTSVGHGMQRRRRFGARRVLPPSRAGDPFGRRSHAPPTEVDDFVQHVLTRILVAGGDGRAGIAAFAGRGSLSGFVRITASRRAIDLLRRNAARPDRVSEVPALFSGGADPEGQLVHDEARDALGDALSEIMRGLKPIERRALRMRYLLGSASPAPPRPCRSTSTACRGW